MAHTNNTWTVESAKNDFDNILSGKSAHYWSKISGTGATKKMYAENRYGLSGNDAEEVNVYVGKACESYIASKEKKQTT